MEILTLILQQRVRDLNEFEYHQNCSSMKSVNLCSADDLFLFSHGDAYLTRVINEALEEFKSALGLVPSLPKSTSYICNVLNHIKKVILADLPFEEVTLPVKHLGVLGFII
ncbi:hypothetical protein Tco_1127238 [Tanacetum coccineum]